MASKLVPRQVCSAFARPLRCCPPYSLRPISRVQSVSQRDMSTEVSTENGVPEPPSVPTPRWKQTPPAMKAPVRLRGPEDKFEVNSDPEKLDKFYIRMLGEGGDEMLSEEVKWQAVTHKSFDQGRRGFNDRLAYLGKQLVSLQATLAIIQDPASYSQVRSEDPHGRVPFQHPVLEGLEVLSGSAAKDLTQKKRMAALARQYDLHEVLRWLPRMSGIDVVLTQAMYAIVGAVSLEKGGSVANEISRERILKPLGFKISGRLE
ncbi:hypothetical protein LOZ12_000215 [Ophidiomyces ophidiicola]|uniref:Uncharacterized protein n=1 Tax=Ophidiomyces ophidiicola TaxID=1387563 RepID=A0ACB8V3Y9_9EURO|nr:hypothetical protein LOZ45_003819 [Ophidiomyces ophidiicola]KAI2038141.1 hypothetical protein LOZ48_000087 [Ophidiomyces ophidiicola]KAI2049001.1 hypothetical protein LOZ44_003836 [Ophidiomyces ophidiicola]KAI2065325.1 hypothetical protein LOZ40_004129 [Ophidiomyces ophidiicola]KAI2164614.1 hypothetical protein LOZ26_000983 [Ophidiomyces ophidiicola]